MYFYNTKDQFRILEIIVKMVINLNFPNATRKHDRHDFLIFISTLLLTWAKDYIFLIAAQSALSLCFGATSL